MTLRENATTDRARRVALLACTALLLAAAVLPGGARAATPAGILAALNAERAANGIPAGIRENATWSTACRLHDEYEKRNGAFGQSEAEGKPGFSTAGNLIAQTSVLAQGIYWSASSLPKHSGDPYDNAPYHLFDLLNPRIGTLGAADAEGFGCVEIELGTTRPAPAAVQAYSYPGNHRKGIATSQRAQEQPQTPAQTVGFGTRTTGPNMLVYFDGPWANGARAQIATVRMASAHGTVPVRWLDNTTSDLLAPTGGILVPASPLRAGTTYRVSVTGTVSGVLAGTSMEQALGACTEQPGGGVECGQPPGTACVEEFATQQAVCGLSRTWAVREDFSFKTARTHRHG